MGRTRSVLVEPAGGAAVVTPWAETAFATVLGAQTGGAFTLTEVLADPGWARPMYVHHAADECFYVLEGTVEIHLDDPGRIVRAGPGDCVYVPRGVGRSLRLLPPAAGRLLVICTPGFLQDRGAPGIEFVVGPAARPEPALPEEFR